MTTVGRQWIAREVEDVDHSHMVILIREGAHHRYKTKVMATEAMDTTRLCRRDAMNLDLRPGV